jgi:hypothetical protein
LRALIFRSSSRPLRLCGEICLKPYFPGVK